MAEKKSKCSHFKENNSEQFLSKTGILKNKSLIFGKTNTILVKFKNKIKFKKKSLIFLLYKQFRKMVILKYALHILADPTRILDYEANLLMNSPQPKYFCKVLKN